MEARGFPSGPASCYLRLRSNIRIRPSASTPNIQGKNRVRESRQHGTVRGVLGNWHPYRDQPPFEAAPRTTTKTDQEQKAAWRLQP